MALPRRGREFRMELATDEPRVDRAARSSRTGLRWPRCPDTRMPASIEMRNVMVVDLVAVAVALDDASPCRRSGAPGCPAAARIPVRPGAWCRPGRTWHRGAPRLPSRSCHSVISAITGMRRVGIEFGAVGAFESGLVARILDHRKLHAEADAEVGDLVLARVADRLDLALHAALAESARNQDGIHVRETAGAVVLDRSRNRCSEC